MVNSVIKCRDVLFGLFVFGAFSSQATLGVLCQFLMFYINQPANAIAYGHLSA